MAAIERGRRVAVQPFATRVRRTIREEGLGGAASRVRKRFGSAFVNLWRRIARNRHHVFVFEGSTEVGLPDELKIRRYDLYGDIPHGTLAAMEAGHGLRQLASDRWQMDRHAILWVAEIDGKYAGSHLTRRGRFFNFWFTELHKEDIVFFRSYVLPAYRGQGISPIMYRFIILKELSAGGRAFIDAKTYNKPAIRSFEKTGFRRFATKKPLMIEGQFDEQEDDGAR
jgi:GNAT superfamily N-acetyltransferase